MKIFKQMSQLLMAPEMIYKHYKQVFRQIVRETFVELYSEDILGNILSQIGTDADEIELGKLDIKDILTSEYAFS